MSNPLSIISALWLIRTIKFVLFWIYLWQLKEYHIPRFIDHFRTAKGRQLLFKGIPLIKYLLFGILLVNVYYFPWVLNVLLVAYLAEVILFGLQIIKHNFKKPVFTIKTILLTIISFIVTGGYLFIITSYIQNSHWFLFLLLLFDILLPIIISCIVLVVQPAFVMQRNRILQKARQKIAGFKNLTVIAITGSYGKTSTKEFLTAILSEDYNVLSTPEHKNSEMGIAQTILNDLHEKHDIFIVEMGSYAKGGIELLCSIAKPRIGIVTGVNQQHLALFGSLDNLLSAEGGRELENNLPHDGLLVVNGDNKYCLDLYKKTTINKKIYTTKPHTVAADIRAEDIHMFEDSLSFVAITAKKEAIHIGADVLGKQNVQNILGAALVAKELGMDLESIAKACTKITPHQAGTTKSLGIHGITIIDSSYSSNPDGVMADLDYLNVFKQKKVVIMPCLIELGKSSEEIHQQIGKKIAEVCDLAIITTKDYFEAIRQGAIMHSLDSKKVILCENSREIFNAVTTFCKEGDTVLLEGRVPGELIRLLKSQSS